MIWLKTILFFFALVASITALEEFVEKTIANSKKSQDEYDVLYTTGFINTIDFWSTFIAILLSTAFYFVNHV